MKLSDIKKVVCIGSGVIGSSWGTNFAMKGYETVMYDTDPEVLALARERIETNLKYLVKNDALTEDGFPAVLERITYTGDMETAVRDAQFLQESVVENYEAKHKVVEELEKYADAEAIYASSTSGLLITEIAKYAKHPERFLGAHPYNPPHLIPLVELTKGDKTYEEVVQLAKEFYEALGKEPVVLQKEALGFISNRLQQAVWREMCELIMRGVCTMEDADKALTFGPGLRWGIMGPGIIFHIAGGKGGLKGLLNAVQGSSNMWMDDMADWKRFPEDWGEIAEAGVLQELANRPPEIGNTVETVAEYRDDMLIALLKLHKKL